MRILFVARSLAVGGAERQLTLLATGLARRGHDVAVHTHHARIAPGHSAALEEAGVPHSTGGVLSFLRRARALQPDVVYGFGPGPNVQSALLGPLLPGCVVWGIRSSNRSLKHFNLLGRAVYRLEGQLGTLARLIIANSRAGQQAARERGMPARKLVVIPNGVDTEHFKFSSDARDRVRQEMSVGESATLVGIIGHLHPAKGHSIYVEAAAGLRDRSTVFVVVGSGNPDVEKHLRGLVDALGLSARIRFIGERHDMRDVYSSLDLVCLPSSYEGFPNVLAEAMACGVPGVVSQAGDMPAIVGDLGTVASPLNAVSLTKALEDAIGRLRADPLEWRRACRDRVIREFSVDKLILSTEAALAEAVRDPMAAGSPDDRMGV